MKRLHFYATPADIGGVLAAIDAEHDLVYRLIGNFGADPGDEAVREYAAGSAIPDLGTARYDAATTCDSFLVGRRETPFEARHIVTSAGEARTLVDQMGNPDTIVFQPGGVWRADVLISGRVATVSDTPAAKALMRVFVSVLTRRFTKIRAFMVGPEAVAILDAGGRLTQSARSPAEYDLARL